MGTTSGMMSLLLAAMMGCVLPIPSEAALTAYDCSSTTMLDTVSIYDLLPKCESTDMTTKRMRMYLVERPPTPVVHAYQCHITFTQFLVDYRGSKRIVSTGREIVDRDTCLNAHESKTIELHGNRVPFLKTNGTVEQTVPNLKPETIEGLSSILGEVTEYTYERIYSITLSKIPGALGWSSNIVRFGKRLDCDYTSFSCQDDYFGQLFWTSNNYAKDSPVNNLSAGFFDVVRITETLTRPETTYVVIHFEDKILALKALDAVTDDLNMEFRSEVENVFIVPQTLDGEYGSFDYQKIVSKSSSEGWEKVYSEVNLDYMLGTPTPSADVLRRLCEAERIRYFRELESIVQRYGRRSFDIYFPREGILGTGFRGRFDVGECTRKYVNQRETETCYKEIPVKYEGKDKFLDPYSRVIMDIATPVNCNSSPEEVTTPPSFTSESLQGLGVKVVNFDFSPEEVTTPPSFTSESLQGLGVKVVNFDFSPEEVTTPPRSTSELLQGPGVEVVNCDSSPEEVTTPPSSTSESLQGPGVEVVGCVSSSDIDWVKIIALILLSIWGGTIFVRLVKVVYLYRKKVTHDVNVEQQKEFVQGGSLLGLNAFSAMVKPPFTG